MTPPSPEVVFITGVVGAAAPEILRVYNLRSSTTGAPFSWVYVLYSVPFLLLGGFLAFIMPATTLWEAFYIGLSTPIVINTALRQADRGKPTGEQAKPESGARLMGAETIPPWKRFVRGI